MLVDAQHNRRIGRHKRRNQQAEQHTSELAARPFRTVEGAMIDLKLTLVAVRHEEKKGCVEGLQLSKPSA